MNKLGIKRTLRGRLAFLDTNGDYQIAKALYYNLLTLKNESIGSESD